MFDPVAMAWMDLTHNVPGTAPSPRAYHGFTLALGRLYVHGGWSEFGDVCRGGGVEKESETGFLDYQKIWLSCFGDSLQKTTRMKQLHAKRVMAQRIVSLHPWHETLDP